MKKSQTKSRPTDPVLFAEKVLGVKLWGLQQEILRAIVANRRVAVRSCHSSGKSYLAAVAALFWLLRWRDSKVIITGPSFLQVRTVIFGQIHSFLRAMKYRIPADQNQTEIRLSPANFILGVSTDSPERLQGHHGGHVLVIIDEAPGVEGQIWEGVESLLASGDTRLLAIGNPVVAAGPFYEAFTRAANSWRTFAISWRDTPNFASVENIEDVLKLDEADLDKNPWPMLLSRRWVIDAWRKWWNGTAEASPLWQARVEGQFPSASENSLISLADLEQARRPAVDSGNKVSVGLDIAGPGDDETVAAVTCDGSLLELRAWNLPDPRGVIADLLTRWRPRLGTVRLDSAGIGYHVGTHLRDLGYAVEMVNVGTAATDPERFLNLRAELSWGMRERFRAGVISGIVDDDMVAQLAALRYELTPRGQVQIESKADMRKRGVRSPDKADALMLSLGVRCGNEAGIANVLRYYTKHAVPPAVDPEVERRYREQAGLLFDLSLAPANPFARLRCAICEQPLDGAWTNLAGDPRGNVAHVECQRAEMYGG
jgi:phage terminase large subunit